MLEANFGIEIEMTGITRSEAAEIVAEYFGTGAYHLGGLYDKYVVSDQTERDWKIVSDSSIRCARKDSEGHLVSANNSYRVELVSPVLKYYPDMEILQEVVRKLRSGGALTNETCGIHIHLDGADHNVRTLRNFINIVASRNDLFYKALAIETSRMQYCKKLDEDLVQIINSRKPVRMMDLENIWYEALDNYNRTDHYNRSRYYFLNLHCFFNGNGTVELRGFNSTLHAGKVRAYVVFALAINHQAIIQKFASYRKVQQDNEKFAMRVYLVRIGLSGKEFQSCREHLCKHLDGNAAWRYGSKENCQSRRKNKS